MRGIMDRATLAFQLFIDSFVLINRNVGYAEIRSAFTRWGSMPAHEKEYWLNNAIIHSLRRD